MSNSKRWAPRLAALLVLAVLVMVPHWWGQQRTAAANDDGLTHLRVTGDVALGGAKRLGINLGFQTHYDGQQMMRNLIFRNPGFESGGYRTIFHCVAGGSSTCIDRRGGIDFPAGFWDGARYEVLDGAASGREGTILRAGKQGGGFTLTLDGSGKAIGAGDWLVAERDQPGDPAAGWWPVLSGGAQLLPETSDLPPHSPGRQALRIEALGPNESAKVASYFDTLEGHSFIRLRGRYRLAFKARSLAGARMLHLRVARLGPGRLPNLERDLRIGSDWADYEQEFAANEPDGLTGNVEVSFTLTGGTMLLDDVICERIEPDNRTQYRAELLESLRALHPGIVRLMATNAGLASPVDELLRPAFARRRWGYAAWHQPQEEIPIGIADLLELCQTLGAEPWIVLPMASTEREARLLAEFLSGSSATAGGALRAASGRVAPWTEEFKSIHIELGNESWNGIFAGQTIDDPAAYGRRANKIFSLLRNAAGGQAGKLDLIAGAQSAWPERDASLLAAAPAANSMAIAPYLMHSVTRWATDDELFGPLLAESEQWTRAGQTKAARAAAGARGLAVYEVNLHTTEGTLPEAALDRLTPSVAAGIAVAGHMLRMQRDLGVRDQALYNLAQYQYRRSDQKGVRLWGSVIELGANGRRRPQFLAAQLANRAIQGDLLRVELTGSNPTHPVLPGNDSVDLPDAHDLDVYAYRDGSRHSLILFNYGLHQTRRIVVDAPGPPAGARLYRLGGGDPAANNESSVQVKIAEEIFTGNELSLPPCSMTVIEWTAP